MEREMNDRERKFLTDLLKNSPSSFKRFMETAQNVLVLWAASLLGMVLIWLLLAWGLSLVVKMDFGFNSQYGVWVLGLFSPLCGLYAICSSVKWIKGWPDHRDALRQDIEGKKVIDERYKINAVKRFHEPEHGGLIYFLLLDDNRVLVLYDYESVTLEMDGKSALASSFKPCRDLHMVRAPNTDYVITQEFSGEHVPLGAPMDLLAPPEQWPEPDTWCEIPWPELESRLAS